MSDPIYFQWQNEILCKSIYPMREPKLRDFLVYYQEIDIWNQLKDKSIDEMPEQVQAYKDAQSAILVQAAENYKSMREYFLTEDVESEYKKTFSEPDSDELTQIKSLHDTFRSYFPKFNDIRKEKYFVSELASSWELRRKYVLGRIKSQERRVDNIQTEHPNKPNEAAKLQRLLTVTLAMLGEELARLEKFAAAISNIETRKLDLDKTQKELTRRKDELTRQMGGLETRITPLEAKIQELNSELARLKNPPDMAALEAYFLTENVTEILLGKYPEISQTLLDTLNTVHKELAQNYAFTNSPAGKAGTVRTYYWRMREVERAAKRDISKLETDLRNMPANWSHRPEQEAALGNQRDTSLPVITAELEKLTDLQAALNNAQKSDSEIAAMITENENELAGVKKNLSELNGQKTELQDELNAIETKLAVPDEKNLVKYTPDKPVTVRDIAFWQSEAYKESLVDKDQYELLKLVRERFEREPERFPLWLQYMVVHFSGMRYASAHGSWADPKDLLVRLRVAGIEAEIKALSDEQVEKICKEKVAAYESTSGQKPALANSPDKEWTQQIGWHLPNVKSNSPQTRRRGLTDLRKLEDAFDVKSKPTEEVLDILLSRKADFPSWAWKEIVRLTPLRLTEVTYENWEKLTPEEEQESYKHENYPMRSLIDTWKNFDVTAWREEHGRTQQLIVSRAVCNETAEHVQHLRGHLPPGGLTPKPNWYIGNEKSQQYPGAYFAKATKAEEYKQGASVLWLRFVNNMPNSWQVAKPVSTKAGIGILPDNVKAGKAGSNKNMPTWFYKVGEVTTRERVLVGEDKNRSKQQQFLRWIHEATVVEVAETADGPTVITYETALPDDYKGISAIGIFKKPLDYFLSDGDGDFYNRSFVGYVPEGQVPVEHIRQLMDWNKILSK